MCKQVIEKIETTQKGVKAIVVYEGKQIMFYEESTSVFEMELRISNYTDEQMKGFIKQVYKNELP